MQRKIVLELKNVSKSYKDGNLEINILKNTNLKVYESEIVAIVGPSGSGKTSLLHIMGLLDKNYSGDVIIDGHIVNSDDKIDLLLKDKIGFVYQYHHLFPEFTTLENVLLPLQIRDCVKNVKNADAIETLDALGLSHAINSKIYNLSGGERQRVAIARAIVKNPAIIFADEPTGNLDSENAQNAFQMMKDIAMQKNISIVVITHDKNISSMCNTIYNLKSSDLQ
jgi:lipoprotein-releasing system ATP-binding protein